MDLWAGGVRCSVMECLLRIHKALVPYTQRKNSFITKYLMYFSKVFNIAEY